MMLTQALCAAATEIFLHKFWVELWVMKTTFFYSFSNNSRNVFFIKINSFAEIHLPKKKKEMVCGDSKPVTIFEACGNFNTVQKNSSLINRES